MTVKIDLVNVFLNGWSIWISVFCGMYLTNDVTVWFKNGGIYNMPEIMSFAII